MRSAQVACKKPNSTQKAIDLFKNSRTRPVFFIWFSTPKREERVQ